VSSRCECRFPAKRKLNEIELDEAVVGVYAGPLDAFVARRDALVKDLRASGQRDAAVTVKNLRKPSRIAWALDLGVLGTPHAMQALDAALNDTLAAHSGSGDVRAAMTGLRNAMRDLAAHAARAAEREGVPVEAAVLTNAIQSVLGTQDSLQLLRRGCLAEVPESDGLDFLATLPSLPRPAAPSKSSRKSNERQNREAELERARLAEADVASARARADAAQQKLRDAETRLKAAEKALREAEAAATAARTDVKNARHEAETAAAALRAAEQAHSATGNTLSAELRSI
jgi:hypothetical protein